MLYEVRDQTFQPDVTRSGMLSSPMPPSELPREVPEHPEAIQSESSENSADEEDGDATDEECVVNAVALGVLSWLLIVRASLQGIRCRNACIGFWMRVERSSSVDGTASTWKFWMIDPPLCIRFVQLASVIVTEADSFERCRVRA